MRILMLGWEFPPHISGGLGTACHGLVRALGRLEVETTFVLPEAAGSAGFERRTPRTSPVGGAVGSVRLVGAGVPLPAPYPAWSGRENIAIGRARDRPGRRQPVGRLLERTGRVRVMSAGVPGGYGGDLAARTDRYAQRCVELSERTEFDVVHAHDWMTFPAGIAVARASGRPLVVHVHATEFDRSGPFANPVAARIEREGMLAADRIIAVSAYTRKIIGTQHGIPMDRIAVVHNGIEPRTSSRRPSTRRRRSRRRTVLFLGRLTRQKGPFRFIEAAAMLSQRMPEIRFLVAGWGDLGPAMVDAAARAGLGGRMRFTGFLRGAAVDHAYRRADAYAMPSLSEPFGLTALEAAGHGVPVVLSRRSGVAEVLHEGALIVDPDDPEMLADRIASILLRSPLADHLRERAAAEVHSASWDQAAVRCLTVHDRVISRNQESSIP
jgi:glycogen(starch) synthase